MKRIYPIDALKGLCALVILLFHSLDGWGWTRLSLQEWFPSSLLLQSLNSSGAVQFFFVLSGFTYCCAYRQKIIDKQLSGIDFSKKVAIRLIPAAWICTTLMAFLIVLYGNVLKLDGRQLDIASWFGDYFFYTAGILGPDFHSLNGPQWFLSALFVSIAVFYFVTIKLPYEGAEYFIAMTAGLIICAYKFQTPLFHDMFFRSVPGFMSGCCTYLAWQKYGQLKYKGILTSVSAIISGITWAVYIYRFDLMASNWIFVYSCVMFPSTILFALGFKPLSFLLSQKPFLWLSDISYSMFLLQWEALYTFQVLRGIPSIHNWIQNTLPVLNNDYAVIAVLNISIIILSTLFHKFIEKPINYYCKRQIERRYTA